MRNFGFDIYWLVKAESKIKDRTRSVKTSRLSPSFDFQRRTTFENYWEFNEAEKTNKFRCEGKSFFYLQENVEIIINWMLKNSNSVRSLSKPLFYSATKIKLPKFRCMMPDGERVSDYFAPKQWKQFYSLFELYDERLP